MMRGRGTFRRAPVSGAGVCKNIRYSSEDLGLRGNLLPQGERLGAGDTSRRGQGSHEQSEKPMSPKSL